jgi:plasmid stabilization system protein ParE
MPRVIWTPEAEEQLFEFGSLGMADELFTLSAGLARFPERGRRVPELVRHSEYNIVREVILPRKARLLYLFIPDSDEVLVLGIIFKGGIFRRDVLGPYFNP